MRRQRGKWEAHDMSMRIWILTLFAFANLHAGTILDGYFRWDDTGIVSGSLVGSHSNRAFALLGIANEDQTFCTLDMWSCNFAGDYFPRVATYGPKLRPDMFFTAGLWDMNFTHFDYSGWTAPRKVVTVPFQMFISADVLSGDPEVPAGLFTLYQGLKGKARLTIVGGPGRYQIQDADFGLVSNPEPISMILVGSGLAALGLWKRRAKRGTVK